MGCQVQLGFMLLWGFGFWGLVEEVRVCAVRLKVRRSGYRVSVSVPHMPPKKAFVVVLTFSTRAHPHLGLTRFRVCLSTIILDPKV